MIELNRKPPDLTICIKERFGKRARAQAEIEIHSPHLQTMKSTFTIPPGMVSWLEANYERIASYRGRDLKKVEDGTSYPTGAYTDAMMQGFGQELYKRFAPDIFKKAFWRLANKLRKDFTSIQIISDNPTIPWELMRPARDDETGERGFLGVEFNVGRWHLAEGVTPVDSPPQSLVIDHLSVIAPKYHDETELRYQSEELKALERMHGYCSVGGRLSELQRFFANKPQGIIHFIGHGGTLRANSVVKDYAIQLEDVLLDVQAWQGLAPRRLNAHPFLFFNACNIGQTQKVANFVNGWAPAMLEAGASGYVGALWAINNRGAYEFAAKFYDILEKELQLGPVTVAEALRRTRATFLTKSDPTFLAYVYYGDPNLTFYARSQ